MSLLVSEIRNTVLPGDCVQIMRRLGSARFCTQLIVAQISRE